MGVGSNRRWGANLGFMRHNQGQRRFLMSTADNEHGVPPWLDRSQDRKRYRRELRLDSQRFISAEIEFRLP